MQNRFERLTQAKESKEDSSLYMLIMQHCEGPQSFNALIAALSHRNLTHEPATLSYLQQAHHAQKTPPAFIASLEAVILASAQQPAIAMASSNAATLLNACSIPLTQKKWAGVQLPGADLRYGVLAHSDLRGANLYGARLANSILYHTNLTGADLREVSFGEYPCLRFKERISVIAHHPRESCLAIAQGFKIVLVHSDTGAAIGHEMQGHTDELTSLAFSPDGAFLVSGSKDKTVRLWDTQTQEPIGQPMKEHNQSVESVAFSQDGARMMSSSGSGVSFKDSTVCLWDVATQKLYGLPLIVHKWDGNLTKVYFSPDGMRIISCNNTTIRLWDVVTQKPYGQISSKYTSCAAFSPDNMRVVYATGYTVHLWDVATQQPYGQPLVGHTGAVTSVAFSPDGTRVVSCSEDGTLRLWDVATQQPYGQLLQDKGSVAMAFFNPNSSRVISIGTGSYNDRKVHLWDVSTEPYAQLIVGHTDSVSSVAFNSEGTRVASGSQDKTVRLWDVATQTPYGQPLVGHTGRVGRVAFSPDGRLVVTGGGFYRSITVSSHQDMIGNDDNTVRLWDVATQKSYGQPLVGHTGSVGCFAFSPDGSLVVTGSSDKTVRLWDVVTQKPYDQPFLGHTGSISHVAFSADGTRLATVSFNDNKIRLWDVATQKPYGQPLIEDTDYVGCVAFNPDGTKVVTAGGMRKNCHEKDNTVRLWNLATQQPDGQPLADRKWWSPGHLAMRSVAFSSKGTHVIGTSNDDTATDGLTEWIHLWQLLQDGSSKRSAVNLKWYQRIRSVVLFPNQKKHDIKDSLLEAKSSSGHSDSVAISDSNDEVYSLCIGDAAGAISFWSVLQKGNNLELRFVGMPKHTSMQSFFNGAQLSGCQMSTISCDLIKQYDGDVSGVIIADGRSNGPAESKSVAGSNAHPLPYSPAANITFFPPIVSIHATTALSSSSTSTLSIATPVEAKTTLPARTSKQKAEAKKAQAQLEVVNDLLDEIYPPAKERMQWLAKLAPYQQRIGLSASADQQGLIKIVEDLIDLAYPVDKERAQWLIKLAPYQQHSEMLTAADQQALIKFEQELEVIQASLIGLQGYN